MDGIYARPLIAQRKTTSVTLGVFSTISVIRMKNSALRKDEKCLSKIEIRSSVTTAFS